MITIKNTTLRNLEEQVEKNQQDIEALWNTDRVLAQLGIKVVGTAENSDHLPDPSLYEGEFGDAYAVGTEPPYVFYVYTRYGADEGYWFNIGQLAIQGVPGEQGPAGPQGEQGIQGPTGASAGFGTPTISVTSRPAGSSPTASITASGDNTSKVFSFSFGIPKGDKGDQGIQGPQGEQGERGDAGGFINIAGIVATVDNLPDPEVLQDLTKAYLVGTSVSNYHCYIQVGSSSPEAVWTDIGILNVATYVTENGEFVGIWDADKKLNKKTDTGNYVYTHSGSTQSQKKYSGNADSDTIALRTSGGQVKVATPSSATDAANKTYVDTAVSGKLDSTKAAVSSVGGLVIPSTTPTTNELVGISTSNAQTRITLGNGLALTDNVLSSTATSNSLVQSTFYGTASGASGGYLVPFLSAAQILSIYNAVKAGQSASIMDLNEEYVCPVIDAWEENTGKIHVCYFYQPYKVLVDCQRINSSTTDTKAIELDLSEYLKNPGSKGSSTVGLYIDSNGAFQRTSTYCGGTLVTLNGLNKSATSASFYAPLYSGNAGQVLKSNGSGSSPEWIDPTGTAVTLNGTSAGSSASFYAPTTAGTSGYVLKSNGNANAPTWIAQPSFSLSGDTLTITLP